MLRGQGVVKIPKLNPEYLEKDAENNKVKRVVLRPQHDPLSLLQSPCQ